MRVTKAAQVSPVWCKLHNFIVENSGTGNTPPLIQGDRIGGTGRVNLQDECDTSVELHRRRRDLEHARNIHGRDREYRSRRAILLNNRLHDSARSIRSLTRPMRRRYISARSFSPQLDAASLHS